MLAYEKELINCFSNGNMGIRLSIAAISQQGETLVGRYCALYYHNHSKKWWSLKSTLLHQQRDLKKTKNALKNVTVAEETKVFFRGVFADNKT
jgi:hypothetical protein